MSADTTATHIAAPHGSKTTEITWADGKRCVYPNEILRGFCPCATCQGHGGTIEFIEGGNAELRDLKPVGHYALNLIWADGHDTGIYSFTYLRDLSARPEVEVHES